jgi:hypothetical protein
MALPSAAIARDIARHDFLAHTAFAQQHDGDIGLRGATDDSQNLLHRGRLGDQAAGGSGR